MIYNITNHTIRYITMPNEVTVTSPLDNNISVEKLRSMCILNNRYLIVAMKGFLGYYDTTDPNATVITLVNSATEIPYSSNGLYYDKSSSTFYIGQTENTAVAYKFSDSIANVQYSNYTDADGYGYQYSVPAFQVSLVSNPFNQSLFDI